MIMTITLELMTAAVFLASTLYGAPSSLKSASVAGPVREHAQQLSISVDQPLTLEEYVRAYFRDTPILAEIARCESRFRHLDRSGTVLRGKLTREDLGVMQINEFYHEETAWRLGFDLHTLDGNLAYAKWLYSKEGVAPWLSSAKCWENSDTIVETEFYGKIVRDNVQASVN